MVQDSRVAVIGGGIAGLVAACELSKSGARVTLFERRPHLGGLASSFEIEQGHHIEKYYHFICRPDKAYLEMLAELGLSSRVHWVTTKMGLFYNGSLYSLGDPITLFAFPHLSILDKIRFGWSTAVSKLRGSKDWKNLENIPASDWLIRRYGRRTYEILYKPLLDLKFRERAPKISAAWMWGRFHRLGNSRTVTQKERVGYVDGGTQAYVDALVKRIRAGGGDIRTSAPIERVVVQSERVTGVRCGGESLPFDHVISTAPIPLAAELFEGVAGPFFDNLRLLEYLGVVVMLLRVKKQFSKYFWTNISDSRMDLPGIIEYTNLNPCGYLGGDALLYLVQYCPHTEKIYTMPDKEIFALYCNYLSVINPDFGPDWVKAWWVHRDRYAQPICEMGFSKLIPTVNTPIKGLFLTDSYQLHPHDRAVTFSTELGRKAAALVRQEIPR